MSLLRAVLLLASIGAGSARADSHADAAGHDEPFLAVDLGVEAAPEAEVTAGLVLGIESSSNNFLVSAGLTRGHGETSFADLALGYYRSFDIGWVTPELGVEIGVLNRTHHLTLLERVGGALLHHFENHMFAGVVSDVNFAIGELANVRGLVEVGYQL